MLTRRIELMFGTGAGIYRNVLGVLSSAVSAVMYRIVGKGQRSDHGETQMGWSLGGFTSQMSGEPKSDILLTR